MAQQTVLYIMPATDGIIIKPELTWTYFDSVEEAFPSLIFHDGFAHACEAYRGMEVKDCWYFHIADPEMFPEVAMLINQMLRIYMQHTFTKCDLCKSTCKMRKKGCAPRHLANWRLNRGTSPDDYRAAHKKEHFAKCQA